MPIYEDDEDVEVIIAPLPEPQVVNTDAERVEIRHVGLQGPEGPPGPQGEQGPPGEGGGGSFDGEHGDLEGRDAPDQHPISAITGLEEALDTLEGDSAYEVAVQNGFEGSESEWLDSLSGLSAYELAVLDGFEGTLQDWLDSLVGPQGIPGPAGADGADGADGVGVPAGGTDAQILAKASNADYDTEWVDAPEGGALPLQLVAQTVTSANAMTVQFTGLSNYKFLLLMTSARGTESGTATTRQLWVQFNGDADANYTNTTSTATGIAVQNLPTAGYGWGSVGLCLIDNTAANATKHLVGVGLINASQNVSSRGGLWTNTTDLISTIELSGSGSNEIAAGASFVLLGVPR